MKKHASLALLALFVGSPLSTSMAAPAVPLSDAPAQEEALPAEEQAEAAPEKIDVNQFATDEAATPGATTSDDASALMPEGVDNGMPVLDEGNTTVVTKKDGAEQLRQMIRIRELKTLTLPDPAVEAEKNRARGTQTPEGWRTAMRNYYTVLYKKMIAKDASLAEALEAELKTKLSALEQHRIYPSKLIEAVPVLPGSQLGDYGETVIVKTPGPVQPLVDDSDPRR